MAILVLRDRAIDHECQNDDIPILVAHAERLRDMDCIDLQCQHTREHS
jgi:hypothetical protein